MSDREALAAALDMPITRESFFNGELKLHAELVEAAARKWHAQLPPYPPALVERIAEIIHHRASPYDAAVAVLDALNQFPAPEEVGK